MDHCCEALIGLVGTHGDTFEFFELGEEVFDQVTPFVHFHVNRERRNTARMLGDDGLGAACVDVGDDGIAVESLVGDQRIEGHALDERRNANCVEALSRQQHEAHEIAERISERQDFGGQAALRAADGLASSPPFAPCPWR